MACLQHILTLNSQSLDLPNRVKGCQVDKFVDDLFFLDLQVAAGDAALTANRHILVVETLQESWQQLGSHDPCGDRNWALDSLILVVVCQ